MHIRPGADADGVDSFIVQQFFPIAVNLGDVELVGYGAARFQAAVGHRHDGQVFYPLKARNVTVADVAAGAD